MCVERSWSRRLRGHQFARPSATCWVRHCSPGRSGGRQKTDVRSAPVRRDVDELGGGNRFMQLCLAVLVALLEEVACSRETAVQRFFPRQRKSH